MPEKRESSNLRSAFAAKAADLGDLLVAVEADHRDAVAARQRKREEVRALDRTIQRLEAHIVALRNMLGEVGDGDGAATFASIHATPGQASRHSPSLTGLRRVQAIEIILAEAGGMELHRTEILEHLRSRGFPSETLGDTSAALAYLKRSRRASNPRRGYWCASRPPAVATNADSQPDV